MMREPSTRQRTAIAAREVRIPVEAGLLTGDLLLPDGAAGLVVFAHGSGSSRHSPRNRYVAQSLHQVGLGTLLMDLLTPEEDVQEEAGAMFRFDVDALAERLVQTSQWLSRDDASRRLPVGYFGASTGAAAALIAAAAEPDRVRAVVSRGGRPDLASPQVLAVVRAPTMFIVGSQDLQVLELNRQAYAHLCCERAFEVVPGATHLFEEPGTLDHAARHARDWFVRWLGHARASSGSSPQRSRSPMR